MSTEPSSSEPLACPGDRLEHVLSTGRFAVTSAYERFTGARAAGRGPLDDSPGVR